MTKEGRHLALNHRNPETSLLTKRVNFREQLQAAEMEAFANTVLRNQDCREVFFDSFLDSPGLARDVATFVEHAHPIELIVQSGRPDRDRSHLLGVGHSSSSVGSKGVAIRPIGTTEWRLLEGTNAIQAIHFGLRSWCVDQLGFLDVTCAADGTYTVYPKHIVPQLTDQELATEMFDALDFAGDWVTVRIPDCALATGIRQRVSVEQAKAVLMDWLTVHPDLVAGVPARLGFITAGLPDRQHALALKSYLRSQGGAYLSHLRIHRMLREHV